MRYIDTILAVLSGRMPYTLPAAAWTTLMVSISKSQDEHDTHPMYLWVPLGSYTGLPCCRVSQAQECDICSSAIAFLLSACSTLINWIQDWFRSQNSPNTHPWEMAWTWNAVTQHAFSKPAWRWWWIGISLVIVIDVRKSQLCAVCIGYQLCYDTHV